ncbi:hypothetical protein CA54_30480 [Symmachiella macrocystis]|uniref:Uncharacterized protein n=1 Tax=Symmachiella macrocystis TaxID=2527985 RepID=A0A5C6BQA8_9PLAN|nr:hypothetical protein [Symmachiella macrocystis]TWU14205.1 hypothetical protein CA54_30480 [Symmachiella macrocystis]
MKQWGIYIAAAIAITFVAVVAMHPSYRQRRMVTQLQRAPSAEDKVRLIQEIIDLSPASAGDILEQYTQHDPTVAFDPLHVVGLISDTTSGKVHIVGDGMLASSFSVGDSPAAKFREIRFLKSDSLLTRFILLEVEGLATPRYREYRFRYDDGELAGEAFDSVRPDDITRWQAEGIWPF